MRCVGEYATNYQDALRDDSRTGLPLVVIAPDGTFARPLRRTRDGFFLKLSYLFRM